MVESSLPNNLLFGMPIRSQQKEEGVPSNLTTLGFNDLRKPPDYTTTVGILMKEGDLEEEDWVNIVNDQVERISQPKDGIRDLPLKSLAEFDGFFLELKLNYVPHRPMKNHGIKVTGDEVFSLKTKGIYNTSAGAITLHGGQVPRTGEVYLWGLDKNLRWMLIKIWFKDDWGYKDSKRREITHVEIHKSSLEDLIADGSPFDGRIIWEGLGDAITEYEEFKRKRHQFALATRSQRTYEEELLGFRHQAHSSIS